MPDEEAHKLDVDFEIIEEPEDDLFPHEPNVISHRGHKVKITAIVRDVPKPQTPTSVTLRAKVFVFGTETMGAQGHVSRPARIFGVARPDVRVTIPENPSFPVKLETIVEKLSEDDHLGQGPDYQAAVNVTTSSVIPPPGATTSAGTTADDDDGLFIINFSAK